MACMMYNALVLNWGKYDGSFEILRNREFPAI